MRFPWCVQGEAGEWNGLEDNQLRSSTHDQQQQRQQRLHSQDYQQQQHQNDAFQRYRHSVMDTDYYATFRSYEPGRCLDECFSDRDV